eukprot:TRINITY_DN287_c1_g1_i1.p1 TRINITY_DN287_c1_g1~~TRINITY_DN287_c1_g1_i1.p1  ORF type:complete len:242 (+),score=120.82 TRINITY_DN287_c1_g1_i1:77-727(+)
MSFFGLLNKNKTFRPKKNVSDARPQQQQLLQHLHSTLGSGNLREAVKLPEGEEEAEWLAVNTVDFFNQINMLYGTLGEYCTAARCPVMSAGAKYEYHWADGREIKKAIRVSAPEYTQYLMAWVEGQLTDEDVFPSKIGVPFPRNFSQVVKTIFKRMFRVYAHIYHSHFEDIVGLGEQAHLNTCFKHFVFFIQEFNLVEKKELAPLQTHIQEICGDQ